MVIPLRVGQNLQRKDVAKNLGNSKVRDVRLWIGLGLLVAAMIIGQLVLSRASARVVAVTLVNDVAAGAVIHESDIGTASVAVPNSETLISLPTEVIGKIAATDLFSGDLVRAHSITSDFATDARMVSVPIHAGHLPGVLAGSKVDVWMTPTTDGVALPGPAQLIIPGAVLVGVPDLIDPSVDTAVTLQISQSQVQVLVQSMRDGAIDLVAVPGSIS